MQNIRFLFHLIFLVPAVMAFPQDVIINKSGVQWNVRIVKEFQDSIHFRFYDEPNGIVKNIDRKYVENVVYEKNYKKLPVDRLTGLITWSGVTERSGKSAAWLLARGKDWMGHPPLSVHLEITSENETEGRITANGTFLYIYNNLLNHPPGGTVHFSLTLFVKEGKYRYLITNFIHTGIKRIPSVGPLEQTEPPRQKEVFETWMFRNNWNRLKIYTEDQINTLVESLGKAMEGDTSPESW